MLVRGELARTVLTADLGRLIRLEGCLSGNVPDNKEGLGNLPPVCREIAELEAGEGGVRAGHLHQHRREPDRGRVPEAPARQPAPGGAGAAEAARKLSRAPRRPAEPSRSAWPARPARRCRPSSCSEMLQLGAALRPHRRPAHRRPRLRVHARVRHRGRGGGAEVALRLPVPVEERGADPGPAAPGLTDAERRRAIDADPRRPTGEKVFQPARGRALHRHRRAGGGRGAGRRGAELDLRAARRRAAADGGHARARVPLAPAAAAARRWRWPRRR